MRLAGTFCYNPQAVFPVYPYKQEARQIRFLEEAAADDRSGGGMDPRQRQIQNI